MYRFWDNWLLIQRRSPHTPPYKKQRRFHTAVYYRRHRCHRWCYKTCRIIIVNVITKPRLKGRKNHRPGRPSSEPSSLLRAKDIHIIPPLPPLCCNDGSQEIHNRRWSGGRRRCAGYADSSGTETQVVRVCAVVRTRLLPGVYLRKENPFTERGCKWFFDVAKIWQVIYLENNGNGLTLIFTLIRITKTKRSPCLNQD